MPASVSESLDFLAGIGRRPDGGVTRTAWSPELFEAYDWVGARMRELGLEVEVDPAGNLIGRWECGRGKALVLGSHLDTVPSGGPFDGVLGVVAAVHAVALLKSTGFEPERPVWIVAFMDEEGTRFDAALFGSRAFTGEDVSAFGDRVDAHGVTLREAMTRNGRELDRAGDACRIGEVDSYVELHIEQGPVLAASGVEIGVVTSIVGLRGFRVRLRGEANHAGTTPMSLRRDALAGAARIVLELRELARRSEGATANVGRLHVEPGGSNVVPGTTDFTVDLRAPTGERLDQLAHDVRELVRRVADEEGLEPQLEETFALEPVELDPELVDVVERAAASEGAVSCRMPSGAGHDAMLLGRLVPAAMIFVPSRDGISHSSAEYTSPSQVELGMRVLAATVRDLMSRGR